MREKIEKIAEQDGRYHPDGIRFIYDGLAYTARNITEEPGHITGQTLCDGLKQFALEKWGRLAMPVLTNWNIKTTRDFGEIVYLMIKNKWMSAQPTDTIEDFDDLFDFKTTFKDKFKF